MEFGPHFIALPVGLPRRADSGIALAPFLGMHVGSIRLLGSHADHLSEVTSNAKISSWCPLLGLLPMSLPWAAGEDLVTICLSDLTVTHLLLPGMLPLVRARLGAFLLLLVQGVHRPLARELRTLYRRKLSLLLNACDTQPLSPLKFFHSGCPLDL